MLDIGDAGYSEDGLLHVQISFRNPEESVIKYNIDDYMLSYHILDSEGDMLQWDNDKHRINRWGDYSSQEVIIDTTRIQETDYVIQFDVTQERGGWLSDRGINCPPLVVHDDRIIGYY